MPSGCLSRRVKDPEISYLLLIAVRACKIAEWSSGRTGACI
jgi:hypothetical protein